MKAYKQVWYCPNCDCEMTLRSPNGLPVSTFEDCPECGTNMRFLKDKSELKENDNAK